MVIPKVISELLDPIKMPNLKLRAIDEGSIGSDRKSCCKGKGGKSGSLRLIFWTMTLSTSQTPGHDRYSMRL